MKLTRAGIEDAYQLWNMQVEAFHDLYQRYQDTETNPGAESIDKTILRLRQPFTYYYFIEEKEITVGAVRVVDKKDCGIPKRISPLFILPAYRNQGLAQKAIQAVEEIHGSSHWELETIVQEKGNCHLYEKMGYYQLEKKVPINDKMTLVLYQKD